MLGQLGWARAEGKEKNSWAGWVDSENESGPSDISLVERHEIRCPHRTTATVISIDRLPTSLLRNLEPRGELASYLKTVQTSHR
jgi:hypothetical protein